MKEKQVQVKKLNFNMGQFCRELSNFGYFNNLQIILKSVKDYKSCKSCTFVIENEMIITTDF